MQELHDDGEVLTFIVGWEDDRVLVLVFGWRHDCDEAEKELEIVIAEEAGRTGEEGGESES